MRFDGKYVVVTGANRGTGLEACRWFVRLGASKVIMGVRDMDKGLRAQEEIMESEHCDPSILQLLQVDFASFDSVKTFARKLEALERLDVLICGAGLTTHSFRLVQGHESQVTVMVISTFLLALMALPKLKSTADQHGVKPYLSIVTSDLHLFTDMPERKDPSIFEALKKKDKAALQRRYLVAKLIQVLVVKELFRLQSLAADVPAAYPVVVNAPNPGTYHTHLTDELGRLPGVIKFFLARTAEEGSRTFVRAASAGPETSGHYLSDCRVGGSSKFVQSKEGFVTQQRVCAELFEILEAIEPGVTKHVAEL
jgi:retinol dehydrogenase 12